MIQVTLPLVFFGCGEPSSYLYIWWTCPQLQSFWSEVFHILSQLFGITIQSDPQIAPLNSSSLELTKNQFKFLLQIATAVIKQVPDLENVIPLLPDIGLLKG